MSFALVCSVFFSSLFLLGLPLGGVRVGAYKVSD